MDFLSKLFDQQQHKIRQLVKDLAHPDSSVRFPAADALAEIGKPALPYLVSALRSDVFHVAFGASQALKRIRLPETTAALIGIVSESDSAGSARERAIEVLGFVGDLHTTQVLLPLLRDPLFEIRRAAATALSQLGWTPSHPQDMALLELCIDGSNLVTPAEINGFNARIQAQGTSAIEPLSNAIKTCRDWRIARAGTGALASIGNIEVLPALYEVVRTYQELHQHDTGDVRKTAALAIARIKARGRVPSATQLAQAPASGLSPQAPLIKVNAPKSLGQGDMIRVWHDQLDRWATNWLEVVDVIDDYIILTDAVTGEEIVRYVSDSIPCWKWIHPAHRSRSPLSSAVHEGHQEVGAVSIAGGANINTIQAGEADALLAAAKNGHESRVKALVDNGAAVNAFTQDGETALMAAANGGNARITKLLLDAGADVSHQDKRGRTALFLASSRGRNEVVRLLVAASSLEAGVKDSQGDTPLEIALDRGHLRVVEILIEAKADINTKDRDGRTPLMIASRKGHLEAVTLFVKNGALLDERDRDGKTALDLAMQNRQTEVEAFLKSSGACEAGVAVPKPWWQFWG